MFPFPFKYATITALLFMSPSLAVLSNIVPLPLIVILFSLKSPLPSK